MATHVSGQAAITAAHPCYLATLRRYVLTIVVGNPLFTEAEQLQTNHSVHECQDDAKLRLWLTNVRRIAAEREEKALASFAQAIERGEELVAAQVAASQQEPTAPQPTATPVAATPAQCDEIHRVACKLSPREKADALRRLPALSEAEAQAFIRGLNLRRGCRLRVPLRLAGRATCVLIPEPQVIAAQVDYVREGGRVLPLYETGFGGGGELVQRVWAN